FFTTVFQGSKASFWKTAPRSAPGPVTSAPSSAIEPDESGRNPAMALRSVDLPQPEAPSATTNARSGISSETRSRACTVRPSRAAKKTLALSTRSMGFKVSWRERLAAPPAWGATRPAGKDLRSWLLDPRHGVRRDERGVGRQDVGD